MKNSKASFHTTPLPLNEIFLECFAEYEMCEENVNENTHLYQCVTKSHVNIPVQPILQGNNCVNNLCAKQ